MPLYPEAQLITNPARGEALLKVIADKRAVLLRGHGIVVAGKNLQEVLYTSLVLEDDAKKSWQAAALGEVGTISAEECRAFGAEIALNGAPRERGTTSPVWKPAGIINRQPGEANCFRRSEKYRSNSSKRSSRSTLSILPRDA